MAPTKTSFLLISQHESCDYWDLRFILIILKGSLKKMSQFRVQFHIAYHPYIDQ